MVLEEVNNAAPFIDNEVPVSDNDTYSSPSDSGVDGAPRAPYQVAFNKSDLPQPFLPFRGARDDQLFQEAMERKCNRAAWVLGRPLREEEAQALCYNFCHGLRLSSYGQPAALIAAGIQFYRTRHSLVFPLGYKPFKEGSSLRPDKFTMLRGQYARMTWAGLRFSAYAIAWGAGMSVVFGSYGMSSAQVRDATDPRLKDYNAALRKRAEEAKKRPERAQDQSGTTQNETFEQRRQRIGVQEAVRQKSPYDSSHGPKDQDAIGQGNIYDDASPTGGAFSAGSYGTNSDFVSDYQAEQAEARQEWQPKQADARTESASLAQARPRQSTAVDEFDTMTATEKPKQVGSAWDRLRQRALDDQSASKKSKDGQ